MGITTTTRKMFTKNGNSMCTATSRLGGKKKWVGSACNNLKSIYNSYNLNHNMYIRNVVYSKTLRKLITIYSDLKIPFPYNNPLLKKYINTRSTILHIKSENLYYIHIGGTYIFIKIPPVSIAYLKTGNATLKKGAAQRNITYNTLKGVARLGATVNP